MVDEALNAPETPVETPATEPVVTESKDEQTQAPPVEEETKTQDKQENPEEVSNDGKGSDKSESVEIPTEKDIKHLKDKLSLIGQEKTLIQKEAEYYKNQYEQLQKSATPVGKKKSEELEEKLKTITDPVEYYKTMKESLMEEVKNEISSVQSKERFKAETWKGLYRDYPEMKDENSDMWKLTDALLKSKSLNGEKELFEGRLPIYLELVKTNLQLAQQSKEKQKIVADIKNTQQTKLKQTGLPQPGKADMKSFDGLTASEIKLAKKLGLKPEDLKGGK